MVRLAHMYNWSRCTDPEQLYKRDPCTLEMSFACDPFKQALTNILHHTFQNHHVKISVCFQRDPKWK